MTGLIDLKFDLELGDILHLWFHAQEGQKGEKGESVAHIFKGDMLITTLKTGNSIDPVFHAWKCEGGATYRLSWNPEDTFMSVVYKYSLEPQLPSPSISPGIKVLWASKYAIPLIDRTEVPEEVPRLSPGSSGSFLGLQGLRGDTLGLPEVSSHMEVGIKEGLKVGPQYHFIPPFGWMNDPNGLSQIGDTIHMFYQHYPHKQSWGPMHWGHAISKDMLRWTHLPIFLFPDESRVRNKLAGGAFSGSAILVPRSISVPPVKHDQIIKPGSPNGGAALHHPEISAYPSLGSHGNPSLENSGSELRVFYTERQDERKPEWEIQMTGVLSSDGLTCRDIKPIIENKPLSLNNIKPINKGDPGSQGNPDLKDDFRDPYVFMGPDTKLKLVIGSRDDAASVVLLYSTDDPTGVGGWHFIKILHRNSRFGSCAAECPCMIHLESNLWVLIYGMLKSQDPITGRRHLTTTIVGSLDDSLCFAPIAEKELDIGTDCYAFQAYQSDKGPRGLAWAANWSDFSNVRKRGGNFPTSMTLPRSLIWKRFDDGYSLITPPIPETESLRRYSITDDPSIFAKGFDIIDGVVELELSWDRPGIPFQLDFEHPELSIALKYDGLELYLHYSGDKETEGPSSKIRGLAVPKYYNPPRYSTSPVNIKSLRVFVDVGIIEVFADDGRYCITKRLHSEHPVRRLRLITDIDNLTLSKAWHISL